MTRIEGKRTLIAGAAMGMGMRMAERFGTEGAELVLVDVNELALEALSQRLRGKGMRVHHFVCDLSQREQVSKVSSPRCTRPPVPSTSW